MGKTKEMFIQMRIRENKPVPKEYYEQPKKKKDENRR